MNSTAKPSSEEETKRQLDALDDQIESLVASLDPDQPDAHPAVYTEIERIHQQIAALKAKARSQGQVLH